MAIKSSILSTVNGFITSIVSVSKVRSALSTLLDNFYPTVLYDTDATTNVFTKTDTDFEYSFKIAKVGRVVNIDGYIENVTASSISDQPIASITNTEYTLATGIYNYNIVATSLSGLVVFVSLRTNSISVFGTIPKDVKFYFNGCYTTKD
jgi:hypothetical protein